MPRDKEKKKEYDRQYNIDNRDKKYERNRQYRIDNKDKINEGIRQYRVDNPEKVKRRQTIDSWIREGLIHPDMKHLYDNIYLPATQCDVCHYVFEKKEKGNNWKCMDRDHDTNLFRQILCNKCNIHDNWKKVMCKSIVNDIIDDVVSN